MAIITESGTGFTGSLDISSYFFAPFSDNHVMLNRAPYATESSIFYAPVKFGPPTPYEITAFSSIVATGYSSAPPLYLFPENPAEYRFAGNGGVVSFSSDKAGMSGGFTISDAFFVDYIASNQSADSSDLRYVPTFGAIDDLQSAIERTSLTFFGSDTGTDIIRAEGGVLTHDDFLYGRGGSDILEGGAGNDLLDGGVGNDILDGGTGNDRLLGGNEVDTLYGREGDDVLDGGIGADVMYGGKSNDVYIVDNVNDKTYERENEGTDTVVTFVDYTAGSSIENVEAFIGFRDIRNNLDTNLTGNDLKNTLTGNFGNNVLDGKGYDDILDGAAGTDTLIGGAGNDTFIFKQGEVANDTIMDFTGYGKAFGDRIVFEGFDAGTYLEKVSGDAYHIVEGLRVETITIHGALDASDYIFV